MGFDFVGVQAGLGRLIARTVFYVKEENNLAAGSIGEVK